jgi:uncharacterized membrane protein
VSQVERLLSGIGGGALTAYGLYRRDWIGAGLAVIGGLFAVRGATGHSNVYGFLNISTAEQKQNFAPGIPHTVSSIPGRRGVRVQRSMTVRRPAEDLYNFWYDIEKAPLYMDYIKSVMKTGERTSHWIAQGPLGNSVEWNSELLQVVPNEVISWHVHGKPTTANAGKVTFEPAPDGLGTVVTLELDFFQFSGALGTSAGKLFAHIPERQVIGTLRHFKELMEAGEIPTIKGQPTGKGRK